MKQNTISRIIPYLLPRTQDAMFICILLIVCVRGSDLFNSDGDLGRHITLGRYMLTNGIPYYDIFSHTMFGEYLVSHEWLAQIAFGAAHLLLGLGGAVLLTAILIAITFTLVYREILRRNVHYLPALLITTLAAVTSMLHWLARPHIFTFLFVALWAYGLQKIMEGKDIRIWTFPLLMLVWANTHGAFIMGFFILAACFAGCIWQYLLKEATWEPGKKLLLIGAFSFAVTFINPYGWRLWGTSVGYFGNKFLVDATIEYQSPNFHDFSAWPFLLMLALCLVAPALGKRIQVYEAFLLAGFAALGLYSERNIPLFAIIAAPYLASMLQPVFEKLPLSNRIQETIRRVEGQLPANSIVLPSLTALLMLMAFKQGVQFDSAGFGYGYDPAKFPVRAVNWLEENPQPGNMFNHFIWGGYLLYRAWPEYPVFIDGQTDFYGEALTVEYVQVVTLHENWKNVLAKYDVSWAIIKADEVELAEALENELGWRILYKDDTATILGEP
jgi:hypothetical protein